MEMINTRLTADTSISAGGTIPVGTVIHKSGCNITAGSSAINISGSGHFKITASVTVEPTAVADMILNVNSNGTAIATASATPAVASDPVNLTIVTSIYKKCGCNENAITFTLNTAGTVTEADIIVERM